MSTTILRHIDRLGDDPRVFAAVLAGYVAGMNEGKFPATRRTPNGDESCVIEQSTVTRDVLGYATFYQPDHRPMMWIDLVWVDPNYRRSDFGASMMGRIIAIARDREIERIEFGTFIDNVAMQRLGEKLQFKKASISYAFDMTKLSS